MMIARSMAARVALAAAGFLSAHTVRAQDTVTSPAADGQGDPQPRFSLTVYSTADPASFDPKALAQLRIAQPYNAAQFRLPGYGVVREIRPVDLETGINTVRFTDVASGIDPTTVAFRSLTAPDTTGVIEQNYEYDLVSAAKLMDKYIGREVVVTRTAGEGEETIQGTLMSSAGGPVSGIVLRTDEGIRLINGAQSVSLAGDTSGLITEPTLVWSVAAEQAGAHDVQVSYQTDGLTWRADYSLVVSEDDTAADVSAWVTLMNQSGASYPDTRLKLVAGDVQRLVPPERQYREQLRDQAAQFGARAAQGFEEKSFFEYHLYTLGRTTSLPDNSTKQIELFAPRSQVPVKKTFVYYGLPQQWRYWYSPHPNTDRNLGTETNKQVDIYLLLENSEENGMGIPLPAGRIRTYKRDDADGSLEFIGEDVVQHTPKDEEVMVKLGSAFDIVGERRQTDFATGPHWATESFEIKLRNHKDERVRVIVKENLYRWVNWEITQHSHPYEKQDYRTIHIPVDVEPDGETVITYSVRYTW